MLRMLPVRPFLPQCALCGGGGPWSSSGASGVLPLACRPKACQLMYHSQQAAMFLPFRSRGGRSSSGSKPPGVFLGPSSTSTFGISKSTSKVHETCEQVCTRQIPQLNVSHLWSRCLRLPRRQSSYCPSARAPALFGPRVSR